MSGTFSDMGQVVLDGSGNGTATVAPPGVTWDVEMTSISTSTSVKCPTFYLYVGGTNPSNLLEGSFSGSLDSSDTKYTVTSGRVIYGVWVGGDPGAVAQIQVRGTVR